MEIKDFIYQPEVNKIIKDNQIYLIGELDSKNRNLFKFYLQNSKLIKTKQLPIKETIYGIISDKDIIYLNDSNKSKIINLNEFKDINLVKIN